MTGLGRENARALVHGRLRQRLVLGMAGEAGLGPLVQAVPDVIRIRREYDSTLLIEHPHPLDSFLAPDRLDLSVQAIAPVLEHVVLGAALDGLAEKIGALCELRDHLLAVCAQGDGRKKTDAQGRDEPHGSNDLEPDPRVHGSAHRPSVGSGKTGK